MSDIAIRGASLRNKLVSLPTWVLLVLTGVLLGLAYPPNMLGGLFGAVGLVPLIIAVERTESWKQALRWSYWSFLIFSALTTWWVGSWQAKADPFLMLSCTLLVLIHPFFFALPVVLYRGVRRRAGVAVGLTFLVLLWCGGEYLHALTDASYPWLTLGNTQTYNFFYIQFIDVTGVWGLSFLMLLQNAVIAWMILTPRREAPAAAQSVVGGPATIHAPDRPGWRIAWTLLASSIILPYVYGFIAASNAGPTVSDPSDDVTITIVQPNQNPWDKWRTTDTVNHILDNAVLSFDAQRNPERITHLDPAFGPKVPVKDSVDMFLWAENAIPYPITDPREDFKRNGRAIGEWREEMLRTVDALGATVMTGFPDFKRYDDIESAPPSSRWGGFGTAEQPKGSYRWDYFNSIGVWVPGGGLVDAYHKSQLVPFGERIPFVDAAPVLIEMLSWDVGISAWGKGEGPRAIDVEVDGRKTRAGAMVCFESIYPNVVRKFTGDGAEFLTIVTNDGWYLGTPGPLQHERFAILRAIENRRAIARAANTGISCFVTPAGRIYGETAEGVRVTTTGVIELRTGETLYVKLGDWLPILCLAGALGIGMWGMFRRAKS